VIGIINEYTDSDNKKKRTCRSSTDKKIDNVLRAKSTIRLPLVDAYFGVICILFFWTCSTITVS